MVKHKRREFPDADMTFFLYVFVYQLGAITVHFLDKQWAGIFIMIVVPIWFLLRLYRIHTAGRRQ